MKWLGKVFCALGIHGPGWHGNDYGRTGVPFERACPRCHFVWWGGEVVAYEGTLRAYRTLGDWRPASHKRQQEYREEMLTSDTR